MAQQQSRKPTVNRAQRLWTITEPNVAERAILDLAVVLHYRESRSAVVSMRAQIVAFEFYQQFGLDETLVEIAKG